MTFISTSVANAVFLLRCICESYSPLSSNKLAGKPKGGRTIEGDMRVSTSFHVDIVHFFLLYSNCPSWTYLPSHSHSMSAFSPMQGPPARFFHACNTFQASSTEIVIYSPSVGQFVTIAWYIFFFYLVLQLSDFAIGLCQMTTRSCPIISDRGCAHAAFTGIVIVACKPALRSLPRSCKLLIMISNRRSLLSAIALHQSAAFTISFFL